MFAKKGLLLTVCSLSILFSSTSFAAAQNIEDLPGYSNMTVGQGFETYLKNNPSLLQALANSKELSMAVLRSATLQSQIQNGKITLAELLDKYAPQQQVADNKAKRGSTVSTEAQRILAQAQAAINSGAARNQAANEIAANTTPEAGARATSEADIAANLALAALIADSPELAAYFRANPAAYTDVLSGRARVEDILAATSRTAPEPQTQVSSGPVPTPPAAPAPVIEKFDLNAIPAASAAQLDANGWPKHLQVPAECPPPQAGIKYFHEGLTYDWSYTDLLPGYGSKTQGGYTAIAHAFKGGWGAHRWTHLTEVENFAVPFVTPSVPRNIYGTMGGYSDLAGNGQSTVALGALSGLWEVSAAHCPGDFNGVTPAGKQPLNVPLPPNTPHTGDNRCASSESNGILQYAVLPRNNVYAASMLERTKRCILEPGERYFYNIRIRLDRLSQWEEFVQNSFRERMEETPFRRNGKPLFGIMLEKSDNLHSTGRPRYVGPCLNSGPYPLGYDSGTCGESRPHENPGVTTASTSTYSCYDPYNQLPSERFVQSWTPEQQRLTWVEGYRRPLFHRHMCEMSNGGPVDASARICAAHREGELREYVATGYSSNKTVQQCQFSPENKRFEWTLVSASSELVTHVNQSTRTQMQDYDRPLEHEGCLVANTVHPFGTKVKITCEAGRRAETRECRQRSRVAGDGDLLGTFVPISVEGSAGHVSDFYSVVVASNRCRYTFE